MAPTWHIVEASPQVTWSYDALADLSTAISVEFFGQDRTVGVEFLRLQHTDESDTWHGCLLVLAGAPDPAATPGRFGLPLAGRRGTVLASAEFSMPRNDNTHLCEDIWIQVDAGHRRRGLASALLAEVARIAVDHHRGTLLLWSDHVPGAAADGVPLLRPPSGEGGVPLDAAAAFALRHGHVLAQVERQSRLPLPVRPEHLAALRAEAEPYAAGYRIESRMGATPPHWHDGIAAMNRAMSADAPYGGVDWEPEVWDAERARRGEERALGAGQLFTTAAFDEATGELVALTRVHAPLEHPDRPEQWTTVVAGPHRGHRLGMLVKVANLQLLAEHWPVGGDLMTWNAHENEYMLAINLALGYQPFSLSAAWQRVLSQPADRTEPPGQ
jgi:GNAT superfamily N-acetyltransferase